jgi:hypothetical protein
MTKCDPNLKIQIQRLHQINVYGRWLFVLLCWLSLGVIGIWGLRDEISLWQEHLTWVAVRYGLAAHFFATLSLFVCVAVTGAVLVWQSRNVLQGIPAREKLRLENRVKKIQRTGPSHPLWKWVFQGTRNN